MFFSGAYHLFKCEFANCGMLGALFSKITPVSKPWFSSWKTVMEYYQDHTCCCKQGWSWQYWLPRSPLFAKHDILGVLFSKMPYVCKQWHLRNTVFQDASSKTGLPRCHVLWTQCGKDAAFHYGIKPAKLWYNVIHTNFGRNLILDKRWPNVWFLWVQRVSNFYPGAGWPAHKWKNSQFSLTRFCLPIILSILANSEDKRRTKVRPQGQILDLMRTNLGFWGQLLVKYRNRT